MATATIDRPKFWSDDFDMDLLKIFPQAEELCGDLVGKTLWTVGHESFGRLNHPTVWNSHGAYLWTDVPLIPRDKHGWFNVQGCVSDSLVIECTWIEWLRDQWSHHYGAIILPASITLPAPPQYEFMELMYDLRKWKKVPVASLEIYRTRVLRWLTRSNERLRSSLAHPERG